MFQDPRFSALNDIHELVLKSAHLCADAAQQVGEGATGDLFDRLRREHEGHARNLEHHIGRFGYPRDPDPEREWAEEMLTRVKKLLADDEVLALIESRLASERAVENAVAEALRLDHDPPFAVGTRELLESIRANSQEHQRDLQTRASHQDE